MNEEFRRKKRNKCNETAFFRGSDEFVYLQLKKSNQQKNNEKNIYESITYKDDRIKFL